MTTCAGRDSLHNQAVHIVRPVRPRAGVPGTGSREPGRTGPGARHDEAADRAGPALPRRQAAERLREGRAHGWAHPDLKAFAAGLAGGFFLRSRCRCCAHARAPCGAGGAVSDVWGGVPGLASVAAQRITQVSRSRPCARLMLGACRALAAPGPDTSARARARDASRFAVSPSHMQPRNRRASQAVVAGCRPGPRERGRPASCCALHCVAAGVRVAATTPAC